MADEIVVRGSELAAVTTFLDRGAAGLAALVVEGEAGIGKSTVWEAGVEAAASRGSLIRTSRPAHAEQGLTLAGLTDLFGDVPDETLAQLPGPQRQALGVALLRIEPGAESPDQRTLSVAVAGLLRRLAAERPVLIAIDDAQWLDESTASILAYALRRLADQPIGLLATVRTGAESPASDGLLAALPADRLERVALGPMHLGGLHRLFQLRLGRSFPRLVLVRIEEASGGNPLYALEMGRALTRDEASIDGRRVLPMPESLGSLIEARVARLPEPTRRAMLLVAASSEPTMETLERARPGIEADLRPGIDDHLVEIDDGAVRFAHPLFTQAVTSLASTADLRSAHEALAQTTQSPDARARHLAQAADGPDESVAAALADAAERARLRGATLDAASLYQEASRLTPATDPEAALDRARLAAECLFIDLSEYVEADRILEAAIDRAAPGPARADALSLRAIIRYYHGRVPQAIELGEAALEEAGGDPGRRARVLGRLGYLVMQLDLERGVGLVDAGVKVLDRAETTQAIDPDTLANVLLLRAVGELGLVRPTRAGDLDRGIGLISASGRSWEHEGADGTAFGIARLTDELDRAIAMTRETIRAKSGPGGDDPFNLVMLSGLLLFRGEWPEARRQAEAAADEYQREGAEIHPAWALRGLALVAAHDGRLDEARAWAIEGVQRAGDRGDAVVELFHHHILGFVALTTGAWTEVDAELTKAAAMADRMAVRHPGRFKIAGDQVEAALALGDVDRAQAVVERLDEAARVAPTPWVVAVRGRSAALVAAARGDLDAAIDLLTMAVEAHDHLPMPFEFARTLLAKGRLHRRRKEKRLADETLSEALACFESLGAPDWVAITRAELGRVGRRPHAPTELTDTERRVAVLAATGLTTREIAERAFIAPKTVGHVLGRVYEKLDIHSRAELGARMSREANAPAPD